MYLCTKYVKICIYNLDNVKLPTINFGEITKRIYDSIKNVFIAQ